MPHILKRAIKGVIYVYEETSYRDKQGRPRTKQKLLGRLDEDGVLIASRKRLREKNMPATIKEYKVVTKYFNLEAVKTNTPEQSQKSRKTRSKKPAPRKTLNRRRKSRRQTLLSRLHKTLTDRIARLSQVRLLV